MTLNDDDKLFNLKQLTQIPHEHYDNIWNGISVEMELDLAIIERSRYTFLDLLSDVGGLFSIVSSIFRGLMTIWNHNAYDYFLISKLFKIQNKPAVPPIGEPRTKSH